MRDGNRLKEKIELRLDQRQVVSFVVVALLLAGAVFALGVAVGKNLAAMPGAAPPKPTNLLDQLDQSAAAGGLDGGNDGLTFQEELTKPAKPLPKLPEKKAVKVATAPKPAPATAKPAAPVPDAAAEEAAAEAAEKPPEIDEPLPAPPPAAKPSVPAPGAPFFTVQVKATQSKEDAARFAKQLATEGFHPFIADVELPGKGHWFRVRVGRFDTRPRAERYLADFKRETHLEAFVTAAGH